MATAHLFARINLCVPFSVCVRAQEIRCTNLNGAESNTLMFSHFFILLLYLYLYLFTLVCVKPTFIIKLTDLPCRKWMPTHSTMKRIIRWRIFVFEAPSEPIMVIVLLCITTKINVLDHSVLTLVVLHAPNKAFQWADQHLICYQCIFSYRVWLIHIDGTLVLWVRGLECEANSESSGKSNCEQIELYTLLHLTIVNSAQANDNQRPIINPFFNWFNWWKIEILDPLHTNTNTFGWLCLN